METRRRMGASQLKAGTRGSRLALAQTAWVIQQLARHIDLTIEPEVVEMKSDHMPLGDGIFVKDIQRALLEGNVDIGVHSLKDLPTAPALGLVIAAIPVRADPREALVGATLESLPEAARVGTSSPRRKAQMHYLRPDVRVDAISGNVDTRIRKVEAGEYNAVMLAAAGLERLGIKADEILPFDAALPAPGQGALAVEVRSADGDLAGLVSGIHHWETRNCVVAERVILSELGGGCLLPVAAYGRVERGKLVLDASVISADGKVRITERAEGDPAKPVTVGRKVARGLIKQGARDLL